MQNPSTPRNMGKRRIVIMGPPGGGKGTQSTFLSQHLGIPHVCTGDIMREVVKNAEASAPENVTNDQKMLSHYMKAGDLIPDELICSVIIEKLSGLDGYLLDGFPRNKKQAWIMDDMIDVVIYVNTDLKECVKRIRNRGQGREDDEEEVALKRIRIYQEQTLPAIEFCKKHQFYEINGNVGREDVQKQIKMIFDE